jgi:hypothetical protein
LSWIQLTPVQALFQSHLARVEPLESNQSLVQVEQLECRQTLLLASMSQNPEQVLRHLMLLQIRPVQASEMSWRNLCPCLAQIRIGYRPQE